MALENTPPHNLFSLSQLHPVVYPNGLLKRALDRGDWEFLSACDCDKVSQVVLASRIAWQSLQCGPQPCAIEAVHTRVDFLNTQLLASCTFDFNDLAYMPLGITYNPSVVGGLIRRRGQERYSGTALDVLSNDTGQHFTADQGRISVADQYRLRQRIQRVHDTLSHEDGMTSP